LGSSFSFLHVDNQFSQHHLLKRLASLVCFGLLYQRSDGCSCVVLFLSFNSVPLVFVSVFVSVLAVFITMAL
jgi:hypothetical protein